MKHKLFVRIIIDIVLVFLVIQGWWFVALPIGLIGGWFFPFYAEILLAGIAYDSLFGMVPGMGFSGYLGTIVSIVVLLIVSGSKSLVRR
jgi:hypothetical protein